MKSFIAFETEVAHGFPCATSVLGILGGSIWEFSNFIAHGPRQAINRKP